MRLFVLLAFALSLTGLAHAQAPAKPTISLIADPPSPEGAPATFRVTLSSPATQRLTFAFDSGGVTGPTGAREAPEGPFDADFRRLAARGDYTFEVGATQVNISVPTIQDTSYEFDEIFFAVIGNFRFNGQPAGNTITQGQTSTFQTILNDDNPPDVTLIQPDPILEGDTLNRARQNYNFTVNIGSTQQDPNREILGRPITLAFTTIDGTAVANGPGGTAAGERDYQPASAPAPDNPNPNPIEVPAGTRQFQYTVIVNGDDAYEGDENFQLRVEYSPPLANTTPSTTVGTIRDNDLPTYTINPADPGARTTVEEGNPAIFIIVLRDRQGEEVPALNDIRFNYSVQNVTATQGADFTDPNNGTFTIRVNESRFMLQFPTIDDNDIEQTETFRFVVRDAVGTIAPEGTGANVGIATILDTADNNAGTILTFQDATVVEGTGGLNNIQFTVNLSRATSQSVSVSYQTLDSIDSNPNARADANSDYTPTTGRLTFAPGETVRTFTIPITTDSLNELDENFRVRLFNPTNAAFANNSEDVIRKATILDDDIAGVITVASADVDVAENTQSRFVNILVNFTPAAGTTQVRPVTVDFTTLPDTAQQAGVRDYFGKSGTLTFRPGVTQQIIPIEIVNDNIREGDESFTVRLSNPNGATLGGQAETRVRILDDDPLPRVSVRPAAPVSEAAGVKNFVVVIDGKSQTPITVGYDFVNGTATNGLDYEGQSGTLTFNPGGPISFFVQARIIEDEIAEGNETFSLSLTKGADDNSFALPQETATSEVVIVDNDLTPSFRISDASFAEGDTGTLETGNEIVFPVTLTRASSRPVTFSYSLLNLRKPECTPANGCDVASNSDYQVVRNVAVTIPPGDTTAEIRVRVTPDALNEFNEQFALVSRALTNAVPTVYADPDNGSQRFGTTAFGTIINDDAGGTITISGPTVFDNETQTFNPATTISEGYDRGGAQRVGETVFFTVTLPSPAGRTVTVNYSFGAGAARDADVQDLTTGPGNGRVTFFNGDTTRVISLRAIADNLAEGSERLNVALSINDNNGVNSYNANGANANVTILDRTPLVNTVTPTIGFPEYGTVPATRVTISGANLRTEGNPRVDAVLFNNVEAGRRSIEYLSDNSIAVTVPINAKSGPLKLRLVDGTIVSTLGLTPAPGAPAAAPIPSFIVQPVIVVFTPTTGVPNASTIAITGRNFQDVNNAVTGIQFSNGVQALVGEGQNVTVINDNRIDLKLPATASSGPLRIVSANGGVGPVSQGVLSVVGANGGGITLGGTPDRNAIVEGSVGNFEQPVRNVNGTFHAPYQFFINPARQNSGANSGAPVAITPITVRFRITASTGGGRIPDIAFRADLEGAGRPTKLVPSSGRDNPGGVGRKTELTFFGNVDGTIDIKLDETFNPASPLEIAIVDAGTDDQPPIVGGAPANVTVTAQIIQSDNPTFFPITPDNQIPTIRVDRVETVNNTNQTAIAFGPGTRTNISIPFVADNTNSVAISDLFDTPPAGRYTIYRLDVANQMNNLTIGGDLKQVPDNGRLERGIGYRLVVADNATVRLNTKTDSRGRTLVTPAGTTFALNLTRNVAFASSTNNQGNSTNGYNFIGFPFNPVQFQNVDFNQAQVTVDGVTRSVPDAAAAGLINPQLFTLDASGALVPANTTVIQPFQAYFVQIFRNNVTLTLRNPT